jgi:hypothetical protein
MSLSFNRDGTMVASDGPAAPDDGSGGLTLWSFPEGRLIKRLPGRPTAISSDWKYYASDHGIYRMEHGKALVSLPDCVFFGFSQDSRYAAAASRHVGMDGARIRVVELPSGRQVSAFGRHAAFAIAMSPTVCL